MTIPAGAAVRETSTGIVGRVVAIPDRYRIRGHRAVLWDGELTWWMAREVWLTYVHRNYYAYKAMLEKGAAPRLVVGGK